MEGEIKIDKAVDFQIGETTLTVEPVPFGNVKKVFRVIAETLTEMSKETGESPIMKVPKIMESKVGEILPLLFWPGKYAFIDQDWIDNHLTTPQIRDIVTTAIKVNGFDDFLAKLGSRFQGQPQASVEESKVKPTVS